MLSHEAIAQAQNEYQRAKSRIFSPDIAKIIIQLFDFSLIFSCSLLSFIIYFVGLYGSTHVWMEYTFLGIVGGVAFVYIVGLQKGYDLDQLISPKNQSKILLIGCCLTPLIITLVVFLLKTGDQLSRGWLVIWWMLASASILPTRLFIASRLTSSRRSGFLKPHAVVIASGGLADDFAAWMARQENNALVELGGIFDRSSVLDTLAKLREPPTLADLRACFNLDYVDTIFVAADTMSDADMNALLNALSGIPVEVVVFAPPILEGEAQDHHSTHTFYGRYPAVKLRESRLKEWNYVIKRLADILIAGTALIALAPLLLLVSLAIKFDSVGPVLFRQRRFGFFNQPIEVLKFRSMYVDKQDAKGANRTVRDDPRITKVGRFIRRTSIDELPQLINVLCGQMSIIGPRAHPISMQVDGDYYYKAVLNYSNRHRVKPGLTGWAQVNGSRGEVATLKQAKRRIELDLYYIDNWSFWLDMQVLLRTVIILFTDDNAY